MMTFKRADRVADRIREELSDILHRHAADRRIALITFTDVKVSDDLRHARVYFVEMGQETCRPETYDALRKATGFLKRELGRRLQLRYMPDINFFVDESFAYASRIERLFAEINYEATKEDTGHDR
ncbi:MAG: 30S ribosome-binding factor RbfA [Syntrophales bacterium]|nr:30S ribosome-binding factor RbfA [Syntrophales bacterium]